MRFCRIVLLLSLVVAVVNHLSLEGSQSEAVPGYRVSGDGYDGVILPFPSAESLGASYLQDYEDLEGWEVTPGDVALLESLLPRVLEAAVHAPEVIDKRCCEDSTARVRSSREIGQIREHLTEYSRQYCGVILPDGSRQVFVNFFVDSLSKPSDPPRWMSEWVIVFDGGNRFWRIRFNVDKKEFLGFNQNGYA